MFVACRDALIGGKSLEELNQGLQELGLDSFELQIERDLSTRFGLNLNSQKSRAEFAEELKRLGLSVCAGLVASALAGKDLGPEIEYVVKGAQLIADIGTKVLRIDVVSRDPEPASLEEYLSRATEGIKECLERTRDLDICFAMENHGLISNRREFIRELLKRVDSERFGLTLDTGNFYWYGYPLSEVYQMIEEFAPYVKHTHVKNIVVPQNLRETQRKPGEMKMSPLERGDIDLKWVVGVLKKAGYDGDLTIEDESLGYFAPEERRGILREDAEFLRRLL